MSRQELAENVPFPLTQWSLVGRAGQVSSERRREALGILLRRYFPALRAHLMAARRISGDAADDLIQGFIADKIIEQNLLANAQQSRGRFRWFLLAALNHYAVSKFRHDSAQKRAPSQRMMDVSNQLDLAAADSEPSAQFTLVWARTVVEEARKRMELHCTEIDRPELWRIFNERILRPATDNTAPASHQQMAGALHLACPKEASNLLITAKRLFARMLRLVVGEYSRNQRQIDEEIADLMRILSGGG